MYARHPDIAKRWESVTPKDQKLPEHKQAPGNETNDSWTKGVGKLRHTPADDFKHLRPSSKARLKTSTQANTKEADIEDYRPKGIEFHIGARPGKLGSAPQKYAGKGQRRDALSATKGLPGIKN